MSAAAFIAHHGGGMPEGVSAFLWVEPKFRGAANPENGVRREFGFVFSYDWTHDGGPDDIVGYREAPC